MQKTEKTSFASRVHLSQLMQPEHANTHGNVHGGWIMKLADEAGALACMRHAQTRVVTVAVDSLVFREPIKIGDLVTFTAEVTYTGRTSMEAEVQVIAENPITGERTHTNTAYLVYVGLNDDNTPTVIPQLVVKTEEEKKRLKKAKLRQQRRIANK
ncbi:acyl-CoA thioesterase [Chloroflexota bacterium]